VLLRFLLLRGWSLIVPENLASTVSGQGSGAPGRGEQVAVGSRGDRLPRVMTNRGTCVVEPVQGRA
jgi:hypothetical protein